jgi:hypothetical protein
LFAILSKEKKDEANWSSAPDKRVYW